MKRITRDRILAVLVAAALVFVSLLMGLRFVAAELPGTTVCCEKTISGLYCQDVPASQCAADSRQTPTSCASTSYCKAGVCYDSNQGNCAGNTPQLVCNANNGTWAEKSPAQCELGCCVLGDQAAFVTLVRCKKLSSFLGLETNYNKGIKDEVSCVISVQSQETGACVYDYEFEKTCKFVTRAECESGVNGTSIKGKFYLGKLCSAEELGTNCGPSTETICIPGKDEVYFVDTCGNPANIYDSSKVNDKEYWSNKKDKSEVCGMNSANANSKSCGSCNYLLGSYCRAATSGNKPTYGDNICADLNCKNTQNGKSYKHGESWCVVNEKEVRGEGLAPVGSRAYRHICNNGQEVVEQCADFRQEECIEDKITTSVGDFSQAGCRVNRWQDCIAQTDERDCTNTDRRDCVWKTGPYEIARGESAKADDGTVKNQKIGYICVPKIPPGLQFWGEEITTPAVVAGPGTLTAVAEQKAEVTSEAGKICAQATFQCVVTFEKGLFGGEECKDNCECWDEKTKGPSAEWIKKNNEICVAMGDCGPNVNWVGAEGYGNGYGTSVTKVESEEKSSGGLFG